MHTHTHTLGEVVYLVPGLRNEQVLPLVHPQYGSLEAMQLLQRHNPTLD